MKNEDIAILLSSQSLALRRNSRLYLTLTCLLAMALVCHSILLIFWPIKVGIMIVSYVMTAVAMCIALSAYFVFSHSLKLFSFLSNFVKGVDVQPPGGTQTKFGSSGESSGDTILNSRQP